MTTHTHRCLVSMVSATLLATALLTAGSRVATPVYFPDDPLAVDPETQDAAKVQSWAISDPFDFLENSFFGPGDHTPQRAQNVNTLDEVPDSSWFTNRAAGRPLTADQVRRGPTTSNGPADGPWTIISGKSDGITPGFTIRDSAGIVWFIKFDPASNPEMATGAEMVSTQLFWALGYHVPENHIATLTRANLRIGSEATIRDLRGRRQVLTERDVAILLTRGAHNADGSFRVIASRAVEGRPVGPFRYYGTRPDDPNDIYPHEHRRELRGLRVFSAWLNHDDSRSINSLDTLAPRNGRTIVWHYLIDFGSTLGSGSVTAQRPRAGNEYIWEGRPTVITALTLGLYVRPWIKVDFPDYPSLGNIEATFFQPAEWKPEYPNQAFQNTRADDLFWAARRVMSISDEAIRAAVDAAHYSSESARNYLGDVIIARRDKIGLTWLAGVNPLVDFALDASGGLTFRNIAADTRRAPAASAYHVRWARFDNTTGNATPVGNAVASTTTTVQVPPDALTGDYVQAEIFADSITHPAWSVPVRVHFRRTASGWQVVGINRQPDADAARP